MVEFTAAGDCDGQPGDELTDLEFHRVVRRTAPRERVMDDRLHVPHIDA